MFSSGPTAPVFVLVRSPEEILPSVYMHTILEEARRNYLDNQLTSRVNLVLSELRLRVQHAGNLLEDVARSLSNLELPEEEFVVRVVNSLREDMSRTENFINTFNLDLNL